MNLPEVVKSKWYGHITSPDGKSTSEHEFESAVGNKGAALTTLLLRVGLQGVGDNSIRIMEEGGIKPNLYGRLTPEQFGGMRTPKGQENFKRYRVTLLPTPLSKHVAQMSLRAPNCNQALQSVMDLHKTPSAEYAGAFVVEAYSQAGQLMVEKQKSRHVLEKAGYTFSGVTRVFPPDPQPIVVPDTAVIVPNRQASWTYDREQSTQPPVTRTVVPARQQAVESIATVLTILKEHTPVVKKAYSVKKD